MPDPRETLLAVSNLVAENSRTGMGGWATGLVATRGSGNVRLIALHDTNGFHIKDVTADTWTPGFNVNNTPAGTITAMDSYPSVFAADWSAASNTNMWAITNNKVLFGSIAGGFVDKTPSGGVTLAPGIGEYRQVMQKCMSDPIQANVFLAFLGALGWRKTLDGGTTWSAITNVPAPTAIPTNDQGTGLACASGQGVWDTSSARTGTSPADRYSIGYVSVGGQGVWKTTDGFASATKVTPSGSLTSTTCLFMIGSTLYGIFASDANCLVASTNNLYKYTGTGTTWTQLGATTPQQYFSAITGVRAAGDLLLNHASGEMTYTADPATPSAYKWFQGNTDASMFVQTKPKNRPFIANTYHNNGGGSAPGPLTLAGGFVYLDMGYGTLRTPAASFPTAGAVTVPNYSSVYPDWEEDSAGYEAIVGQSTCFALYALWCNAQDVGTIVYHDEKSGHDNTYAEFPGTTLTNAFGISVCPSDRAFGVVGSFKNGPNFGVSTDGRNFTKMANQPTNSNPQNVGGAVIAGKVGSTKIALWTPTTGGAVPKYSMGAGSSPWLNMVFYKTSTGTGSPVDTSFDFNGFNGTDYYDNHWPLIADPANDGVFYIVNRGGNLLSSDPGYAADTDPAGNAGIYKIDFNVEPGVGRRIYAGQPIATGNRGYYRMYLEITADRHLLIMANPQPGGNNTGNYSVDYNLTAGTMRTITTVYDINAWALGAPLVPGGPEALWAAGWYNNQYAIWLSFDRFQTAPWGPSGTPKAFNFRTPLGGAIKCLDAHPTKFGLLAAALENGHAKFTLQA